MEKEHFIQLTIRLYRLTLLFPKKEPLRYKMRELADDILAGLISLSAQNPGSTFFTIVKNAEKNLVILDSFFELAKSQNWVSPNEIFQVQREYSKLKEVILAYPETKITQVRPVQILEIKKVEDEEKVEVTKVRPSSNLGGRQQKILEILKEKGEIQVWELKKIIPEVSKRTLRRDFENLLRQGIIERKGERNATYYQLKMGQ